ncbi:MAG: transporter [Mucilaginibacter sp.]|nr:transporter [Mucilaginibacter sp.]
MPNSLTAKASRNVIFLVIVASLGYFVDIYDLLVFSIIRKTSLLDIGVSPDNVLSEGIYIINLQVFGLMIGGILWGVMGDKLGRIKVLFGSILLYSAANFANGFVHDVNTYAVIRFIAGIGLAGELGAGITLVTETMSKEKRGYGAMIVSAVGVLGATGAVFAARYGWRNAYFIGAGLGLLLLLLRLGTFESGLFKNIEQTNISKGNFFSLFTSFKKFKKYLCCILIGAPSWLVTGVLVTLAPEFGKVLGAKEALSAGDGIMYLYIGLAVGGMFAGLFSQVTRSRKLTMLVFQILLIVGEIVYLRSTGITNRQFIGLCIFMGFGVGFWPIFITIAAEQFGTNIRSTVATTVPNFVRALLIPINFGFIFFKGSHGMINSAYIMMCILNVIAFLSLSQLKETFGKDLNYLEESETEKPIASIAPA